MTRSKRSRTRRSNRQTYDGFAAAPVQRHFSLSPDGVIAPETAMQLFDERGETI